MWTRKEIKERAKEALKRNYWKIIMVNALAMALSGGISYYTSYSNSRNVADNLIAVDETQHEEMTGEVYAPQYEEMTGEVYVPQYEEMTEEADRVQIEEMMEDDLWQDEESYMNAREEVLIIIIVAVIIIIVTLIVMAVMYVVIALLYNPFYVGVQRFMLRSVDDSGDIREIAYGFDHSYKNIVKTMFMVDMKVCLWMLLFIVPGIYKKYQYRMVSYILAEHPDMEPKAVLQMSKDMMNGQKWHVFVLDLSFILWHMTSLITCGISAIFYVNPYIYLTNAALYRRLCVPYNGGPRLEETVYGNGS